LTPSPPSRFGRVYASVGDLELAGLALRGDREASGELVQRATPLVRALVRRMGAQPALANDVTQDALLDALRAIHTYRGEASFASWVSKIAAHRYAKRCRHDARYALMAEPLDVEAHDPAAPNPGEQHDLDGALATLSPIEQLCVSLCHGAGFSHGEIADSLQIPLGTAKSHVARALAKLRRHLLADTRSRQGERS
jgi:RNA polymerase sigma-70 factor, ECF subfamily